MTGLEQLAVGMMVLALVLAMLRLLLGPGAADRVIAADTLGVLFTVAIVGIAAIFGNALYLDVALIYGVLSFVGVVAIARAIEGHRSGTEEEQ
ncbi:MAG: cation:proton antiporter [Gammaproteobacteria bacterium]|nr:cation:proton antiporter [Gammaproteobacteria bacterium]MCP5137747.1 cation:proton antiporter [Gammaproteobacteria bacterium]